MRFCAAVEPYIAMVLQDWGVSSGGEDAEARSSVLLQVHPPAPHACVMCSLLAPCTAVVHEATGCEDAASSLLATRSFRACMRSLGGV